MNLVQVLQEQAGGRPDAAAIIDVCGGRYRTMIFAGWIRSQRAATLLREAG
jgi:hypothetical protein